MRFRWDDFVLDLDAFRLERGGSPLSLEPKALNLLALIVRRPGHLFTKQELFDAIWPDTAVTDHALTRVVAQLRRALGDEAREARYIETVPTKGYRWVRPVEVASGPETADQGPPIVQAATPIGPTVDERRRAVFPGLAAALAVATVLLAVLSWTQRVEPTAATAMDPSSGSSRHDVTWPVQVTTNAGLDLQPAISPQGDAMAYVSERTGAFEIYVRPFGGTPTDTPLTSDGLQNVQPAWSPDGRLIAYHSYRRGGIWLLPARGGMPKQLAAGGSNPAWSPDGRRLAFQSDEHADVTPSAFGAQAGSTIWIVDADGSNLRELTRAGQPLGGHAAPAWSRDGRFVAFAVFEAGPDNGIWIAEAASGATRLLQRGSGLYELVFAPDGSALYVAGGEALVERLPFDPQTGTVSGPRGVIPVAGVPGVRGLTISADGKQLAFAGLGSSSQIWMQPISRDGAPSGPARPLTSDTSRRNSLPKISPDGSKVAYMSRRGGASPGIWVVDIARRNLVQVTSDATPAFQPHWLPDGDRVAYISNPAIRPGVVAMSLTTRREEPLFDLGRLPLSKAPDERRRVAEFTLSPSATRIAVAVMTEPHGKRTIYTTTLDPFEPRAISDGSLSVGYPSWSPDERRIAVEIKDGSSTHAGVIDIATGTLRRLTDQRGQTWVRSWSPDSRRIAAATLRDGVWDLRWIDADTGAQGPITAAEPPRIYVRYPEWSPRGDAVVFERGELRGNIWMLKLP